jgi:hypothetical protein
MFLAFVDIDANYEQDIAKLIAAALRKSRQLEDGQPDSDEESVIIEADPDDRTLAGTRMFIHSFCCSDCR